MTQAAEMARDQTIQRFYDTYHDRIFDKRYNSPYWIRRYTHRQIHEQILRHVEAGQEVLDVGCGEGVFSLLAGQRGTIVTGVDVSRPNVQAARRLAAEWGVRAEFFQADAEKLPFGNDSFDVVVSSHVLEHLPHLFQGLRELYRVTRSIALIAMPTCLNPACWVLLGGDDYWRLGWRSPVGLPVGVAKVLIAWLRGQEGPNEGYAGHHRLPHIWRFPWIMKGQIERVGFHIMRFEAGPLIIPYLAEYLPVMRRVQAALDRHCDHRLLRYVGYGSLAVCRKDRGGRRMDVLPEGDSG